MATRKLLSIESGYHSQGSPSLTMITKQLNKRSGSCIYRVYSNRKKIITISNFA